MVQVAMMIMVLVVAGLWHTGRRLNSARWQKDNAPLIPFPVYLALFAGGLILALLLH
jgi:hypothetical protein